MLVQCSYCGRVFGYKDIPGSEDKVSHGMCSVCQPIVNADLNRPLKDTVRLCKAARDGAANKEGKNE